MLFWRAPDFADTALIIAASCSTPSLFTAIYQHKRTPASSLSTLPILISIPPNPTPDISPFLRSVASTHTISNPTQDSSALARLVYCPARCAQTKSWISCARISLRNSVG
jgi:hypothetical protein